MESAKDFSACADKSLMDVVEVRKQLMAAGRHLSATRMGWAVSNHAAPGINFGGCSKTHICDRVIEAIEMIDGGASSKVELKQKGFHYSLNLDSLLWAIRAQTPQVQDVRLMLEGIKSHHEWTGFDMAKALSYERQERY